jgi:stress-induced morphogen
VFIVADERINVAVKQKSELASHGNDLEMLVKTEPLPVDEELIKVAVKIEPASSSQEFALEDVEIYASEEFIEVETEDGSAEGYHEDGGDAAVVNEDNIMLFLNENDSFSENSDVGEEDPLMTDYRTCDEDTKVTLPVASASTIEQINEDTKSTEKRNPVVFSDHIRVITGAPGEPTMFKCTICASKFKVKAHVKYHEYCADSNKPKPFKCEQCSREFITKSHYEYHLRTHTGERPFQCQVCKKDFNQKSKLTRHARVHSGEKRFKCNLCGKNFVHSESLRTHRSRRHVENPFFKCDICQVSFETSKALGKHHLTHVKYTREEATTTTTHKKQPLCKCGECGRSFSARRDLVRHLLTHTEERPFSCLVCDTKFRRKDNLTRHMKAAHKDFTEPATQMTENCVDDKSILLQII